MDTTNLLKIASEAKPELIEKVATHIKLIESLAPAFVPEVVQELNEITELTHEKLATLGDLGRALGAASASALGAAIATDLFDAAKRGLTKSTNFRRIMDANPDLKDIDTARLKSSFDTVHRYAPEFTSDPILGGSILRAVSELPGNELVMIRDLIKSRSELAGVKSRQLEFTNAGKAFGESVKENPKKDKYNPSEDTKPKTFSEVVFGKYR